MAHYSKSLHLPYFKHIVVLSAYKIAKENDEAGRLTFEKMMSVYGHVECEDEKQEM